MKNHLSIKSLLLIACCSLVTFQCKDKDGDVNIFSIEDDKKLGERVKGEIAANPAEYPILSRTEYATAYGHIDRITDKLLNSGKLNYKDEFDWEVFLVNKNVLNAFCTPGGKIYVYTGLIKYLETEDHLAGVMGHEIAHADHRHSTDAMTKQYGYSTLIGVVLGNDNLLGQITNSLINLKFSRANETESDLSSVEYLSATNYACNGTAGFFERLISEGEAGRGPEFLSTHPNPDNRVENINNKANAISCSKSPYSGGTYQDFKNSLPANYQ